MKHFLSLLGIGAAIIMIGVSAVMNWRFGYLLGKDDIDGHILGAASVAADGLKALSPFFIGWAIKQRNYLQASAGVFILVVCASYSLASSLGFSALNRNNMAGEREIAATTYQDWRGDLARVEDKLKRIPEHRSVGEVEADLNAAMATQISNHKKGVALGTVAELSKDCAEAAYGTQRICAKVLTLRKELAISQQAQKLEDEIKGLRLKLAKVTEHNKGAAVTSQDPQSAFIAKLSGLNIEYIQTGLTIMVSLLVEIASSLGLYVATSPYRNGRDEKDEKVAQREKDNSSQNSNVEVMSPAAVAMPVNRLMLPKSDLERYYDARVVQSNGSSVTAIVLYDDYCKWCERHSREPMALSVFGRQFSELGIQKAKIGGRIRYIGIALCDLDEETAEEGDVPNKVLAFG